MNDEETESKPQNVIGIFVAQFHVRTGNEIVWQLPSSSQGLNLDSVEWKVLPSGSHLVQIPEKDPSCVAQLGSFLSIFLINFHSYFQPPPPTSGNHSHRLGVAAFRNRKIEKSNSSSSASNGQALDQRGARMIAIGLILECSSDEPSSHLKASLPHLQSLGSLAEAFSQDPSRGYQDLESYFHSFKFESRSSIDSFRDPQLPNEQDPILQLPALTSAIGPIFPGLIKRLLQPPSRLLIFSSPPTFPASSLAYNLSLLIQSTLSSIDNRTTSPHLLVRGIIGLHDISRLSDENKLRTSGELGNGWIAWTTDKLLLEKPELYDLLLDLTPIASTESEFKNPSLPKLFSTVQVKDKKSSRMKSQLKSQSWTAKELALFTQLDSKAVEMAEKVKAEPQEEEIEIRDAGNRSTDNNLERRNQSESISNPTGRFLFTLLTLIRYYLSGIWFLPTTSWSPLFLASSPSARGNPRRIENRSRSNGNFLLPLGIRGDGGVRTSVIVSDQQDEVEDQDESEDSQDEVVDRVENRGGKGKGKAIEASHRNESKIKRKASSLSRNISNVDDDDDEVIGDPLLAAAGARSPRKNRKSITGQPEQRTMPGDYSHQEEEEDYDDEELSEEEEFRERILFAKSLARVWSDWSRNLYQDLEKLLKRISSSSAAEEGQDDDDEEQRRLILTSKELSEIGLSSSNHVDVLLIRSVADRILKGSGERIVIKREWWRFL